jgi:hypothetical protein
MGPSLPLDRGPEKLDPDMPEQAAGDPAGRMTAVEIVRSVAGRPAWVETGGCLIEFAPQGYPPATSTPSRSTPNRAATRCAVASRLALIPEAAVRAAERIAGGAVSGVPLLKGGSGA